MKTFDTIWQSFTDVSRSRFWDPAATELLLWSVLSQFYCSQNHFPGGCIFLCVFFYSSRSQENLGSCLSAEEMVDLMWCCAAASQLNLRRGTNMLQASIFGASTKVLVFTWNSSIVCYSRVCVCVCLSLCVFIYPDAFSHGELWKYIHQIYYTPSPL